MIQFASTRWQTLRDPEIRELPTIRAQFLRIYEAICARGRNDQINGHVLRLVNKPGRAGTENLIHQISAAKDMNSY